MLEDGEQIDIWVVEKRLGSGGMGSVYRCHNRSATRIKAAVKVIDTRNQNPDTKARFIREAEIMFGLDHPNIVKVRNVRTDHDPPYLEMEFVEGRALEEELQSGPLELAVAMDRMEQASSAIAYLHSQAIYHRDIKPANLLVSTKGRLKLVDFGLAVEADNSRITQAGTAFGTVAYAPPEWIIPERLQPDSWDIYALGVVFWEMLTGRVAFASSGEGSARQQAMQVMVGKQNHAPLDPGEGFSDEIRDLIRRMTDADASRRCSSAAEVWQRCTAFTTTGRGANVTLAPVDVDLESVSERIRREAEKPRRLPAAVTADTPMLAPPKPRSFPLISFLLAGCAFALTLLAAAGGWVGYTSWGGPTFAELRQVDVTVKGVSADTPLSIRLGEERGVLEAGQHRFLEVPTGRTQLTWVIGADCPPDLCPGSACPGWCASGSELREVEAGDGTLTFELALAPPPVRDVYLSGVADATVTLGGQLAVFTKDGWHVALPPGRHALVVTVGDRSDERRVEVPVGAGRLEIPLPAFEDPELVAVPTPGSQPSTQPVPLPEPVAPEPVDPEPVAPEPSSNAGPAVTNAQYAAWLVGHSQFSPGTSGAAGAAKGSYLKDWAGDAPAAGTESHAVTAVSPYLAMKYCRTQVGTELADVTDAPNPPPRWEFRMKDNRYVALDTSGATTPANDARRVFSSAGFRCQR